MGLGQLMRLFPSLTHLLTIIVNLILLQAKVKFILLILYKYTLYRLKLKTNIKKLFSQNYKLASHDRLSLGLGQLMRLFPSLTHLLAIIINLILLQAKVKFILLILYKYTLYRLKPKININKQTNFDFCFLSIDICKFLIQNLRFNCMFGTWYITYFLIIFQMESEEGEEMEVARDVVVIPIRDRSEESVSPYSTEDGVTLIQIAKRNNKSTEMKSFLL